MTPLNTVEIQTLTDVKGLELTDLVIEDIKKFNFEEWKEINSRLKRG